MNAGNLGNCTSKENFIAIVDSLDNQELMRLLGQRMQPLRLAALGHAALLCNKHRTNEEVLRNCCECLHRHAVPSSSSSVSNSNSNVNVSAASNNKNSTKPTNVSAKEQIFMRKYLKIRQDVEASLQLLHRPEERHPTTLCYGLLALGSLTTWDLEAHKLFHLSHVVGQVMQVMKVHMQNSGVQE